MPQPYTSRVYYGCILYLLLSGVIAIGDETHNEQIAAAPPKIVSAKLGNLEETHASVLVSIEHGRYDEAVEYYRRLLEIDPQLRSGFSDLSLKSDIVLKTSLETGRGEVEKLLSDIPVLRSQITKDDAIHQWLVTCFSGRDSCNSIIWNKSDPEGRANADHQHPTPGQAAELRIRQQRTRLSLFGVPIKTAATHDEVWFSLVFEIYNSQNYRRFNELRELARNGVLVRDSFIAEVLRTEFDAELKAKAFYVYEFYPLMRTRNIYTDPSIWRLHAPLTHAERIVACRALEPAWDKYGREYDIIVETKGVKTPRQSREAPNVLEVLDNPAFELPLREGKITGWDYATGPGIKAVIDVAQGHEKALHLVSTADGKQQAPVIWVRSNQFPAPKTGRLSLTALVRMDNPSKQPQLRLAVDGKVDGKNFYRRANIGASQDGQPARAIQKQWLPYRFQINDLPLEGITELRVGFDLMGEGDVHIDNVSVDSSRPESATAFVIRLVTALSSSPSRPSYGDW